MGAAWTGRRGKHRPAIFPGRAEQGAASRLLANAAVPMEHRRESQCVKTAARCLHPAPRSITSVDRTTTRNALRCRGPVVSLNRRDGSIPLRAGVSGGGGVQGNFAQSRHS